MFVGSPIRADKKEAERLGSGDFFFPSVFVIHIKGAQLKKNGVAVDIINFGEGSAEENAPLLEAFHAKVNNHDNRSLLASAFGILSLFSSNIVTLPPGETMLRQMISATPIIRGNAGEGGSASDAGANEEFEVFLVEIRLFFLTQVWFRSRY